MRSKLFYCYYSMPYTHLLTRFRFIVIEFVRVSLSAMHTHPPFSSTYEKENMCRMIFGVPLDIVYLGLNYSC